MIKELKNYKIKINNINKNCLILLNKRLVNSVNNIQ